MGYTNITLVERTLANTLTSSSPTNLSQAQDLIRIGNTLDFNVIDESIVNQFIQWADAEINAAVSQLYEVPLCEIADFETTLISDINDYNDYIITPGSCPFYVGDVILLVEKDYEERHIIDEIVNEDENNIFQTVEPISYAFKAACTRVIRLRFPDPITLMSSRWAAASVYEKYFMAEASPSESEYGKWMRSLFRDDINGIINGNIILHGVHRIGRRFFNSTLVSQYGLPRNKGEGKWEGSR